ncbi:MAG: YgiT-type zinc finger protein, partial [Acidobacteriota bacterium]|nr:YgiT-type zinc finger protein [Acidobacteriota bacterium]
MMCHKCGNSMTKKVTDLPFKLDDHRIIVIKDVPIFLCSKCGEILIENEVMKKLNPVFSDVKRDRELEVVKYAA